MVNCAAGAVMRNEDSREFETRYYDVSILELCRASKRRELALLRVTFPDIFCKHFKHLLKKGTALDNYLEVSSVLRVRGRFLKSLKCLS